MSDIENDSVKVERELPMVDIEELESRFEMAMIDPNLPPAPEPSCTICTC